MPLPLLALTGVGTIITAITATLATKAGTFLAAAGLTFIAITGMQTIIGFLVADMNTAIAAYGAFAGSGTGALGIGSKMIKMAAYVGLFDAFNIVISATMAALSIVGTKVMLARLQG